MIGWADLLEKVEKLISIDESTKLFESYCKEVYTYNKEELVDWIVTGVNSIEKSGRYSIFINIMTDIFLDWLFDNPILNQYAFMSFIEANMKNSSFIEGIENFAGDFFRKYQKYEAEMDLDLNILLTVQGPIFYYCISENNKSDFVMNIWFDAISESYGECIFGSNRIKSLKYFKIMNHAFLQSAILPINPDITPGETFSPMIKSILKKIKTAICAIVTELDK